MDSKKRKELMLLYLANSDDYITAQEFSEKLNISKKTIYRSIKEINEESKTGNLIYSKKGSGYKLDYENYLKDPPKKIGNSGLSPTERRNSITEALLLHSPNEKKVYKLYEKYYVSESVISSDIRKISDLLKKYNLTLIKRNYRIKIIGEETDIRRAINDLIQTEGTIINVDKLKEDQTQEYNKYDVDYILRQINYIESKLKIKFPHPYDINIFSHLYILINRVRKSGNKLSADVNISDDNKTFETKLENKLYKISEHVLNNIERYLDTKLPLSETYYLYQYLVSSRMQTSSETTNYDVINSNKLSSEVEEVTDFYIEEMNHRLQLNFNKENLFRDLSKHIQPMLNRLKNGLEIKNSLLKQIKLEYEQIYKNIQEVSKLLSKKFDYGTISNDENGFLTLYFAQAFEGTENKINTLILCTSGIGTSELLRVKISKRFPELQIIDVTASYNVKEILEKHPEIDFIITTVNLMTTVNIPVLMVSAIFNNEDQKRLQDIIEDFQNGR